MIGRTVSHFRIQATLGEGGMGKVYLATDVELHRKVALKFLLPQYTEDEDIKSRFKIEARTMAALNHPNITTVYEVGEYKNSAFIAMEYVEGDSLQKLLLNREINLKQALDIMAQVCEGLGEAHKQTIVHRDIKPGNLLLEKHGRVKILDFGLAKLKEASRATSNSSTVGTLYYLSPEQIQNISVDHRSDLFACGVVLYEMITGKIPFKGDYEAAVMYSILNEQPEPLSRYKSGISDTLQRIIDKALTKDPELRYQSAEDFLSDLKRAMDEKKRTDTTTQLAAPVKKTRKLAAIMFTDIVGYSRMMGKDEEATIRLLEDYESVVTPTIQRNQGEILKKIGDGLFCEFSSAIDAVECSLEIQKEMHDYNQKMTRQNPIQVRIGIHVGDVIKKDNDLFGDGVNVAARIEPLAPPGGIYISDSVHSAISSHPRFNIKEIGLSKLKNIKKEHHLYQVLTVFESEDFGVKRADSDFLDITSNKQKPTLWLQAWKLATSNPFKIVVGLVIIITVVLIFKEQLYNISDIFRTDQESENSPQSIQSNSNDHQAFGSEIADILQSDPSIKLISDILNIKEIDKVLEYLIKNQDRGNLKFGKKSQFSDPEGTFIIISDETQVHTILFYHKAMFYDTINKLSYNTLSDKFRGKRTIWIKLL
jgi:serine/threonine protein kinase